MTFKLNSHTDLQKLTVDEVGLAPREWIEALEDESAQAADERRHLGRRQRQQLGPVDRRQVRSAQNNTL